jgi:hypothetical protein
VKETCNQYVVVALNVDTKSIGRSFQVMAQSIGVDRIPPGPKLDALTVEKVFGWKNVHKHDGALIGKKRDKAGRWRLAEVIKAIGQYLRLTVTRNGMLFRRFSLRNGVFVGFLRHAQCRALCQGSRLRSSKIYSTYRQ